MKQYWPVEFNWNGDPMAQHDAAPGTKCSDCDKSAVTVIYLDPLCADCATKLGDAEYGSDSPHVPESPNMCRAIRAFRRALYGTRSEQIARAKFEAADRMFDGGEWSGPIQDRRYYDRATRIAEVVCDRMHVDMIALRDRVGL